MASPLKQAEGLIIQDEKKLVESTHLLNQRALTDLRHSQAAFYT